MKYWGKLGAFWGGVWGLLFGSAMFLIPGVGPLLVAGPLVGWIVGALEGAVVVGGLSAMGAGLYSLGIPHYLDVSTQAFHNEPRFKWTDGTNGNFQQETYSNTKVAANDGVNTRQKVREGTAKTYAPLAQGNSFDDVSITFRIYAAMRADASLSENAQNVEVGALNGRVTLRGHVNTEAGKLAIGKIAATVGRPENVSNLLEVRALPVALKLAN
jgi:hypothetical protein